MQMSKMLWSAMTGVSARAKTRLHSIAEGEWERKGEKERGRVEKKRQKEVKKQLERE